MRLFNNIWNKLFYILEFPIRYIWGRDIFISYSRRDTFDYPENLVVILQDRVLDLVKQKKLPKTKLSFYLDKFIAPPSGSLPPSLIRHLRWSSMLVILCTEEAVAPKSKVTDEIELFSRLGRKVILINVNNVLSKVDFKESPWKEIRGAAPEDESIEAVKSSTPSENVIVRILESAKFTKQDKRLKQSVWATVLLVLLLLGGAASVSNAVIKNARDKATADVKDAQAKVEKANEDVKDAEAKVKKANKDAEKITEQANKDVADAKIKENDANKKAETANKLADKQTRIAADKTKEADLASENAVKASQLAEQKTKEAQSATFKAKTENEVAKGNENISNSITSRLNGNAYESLDTAIKGFKTLKNNKRDLTIPTNAIRGGLIANALWLNTEEKELTDVIATNLSQDTTKIAVCKKGNIEILNSENLDKIKNIPFSNAKFVEEIFIDNSANIIVIKSKKDSEKSQIWILDQRKSNAEWIQLPLQSLEYQNLQIRTFALSSSGEKLAVSVENTYNPKNSNQGIYIYNINELNKFTIISEFSKSKVISISFSPDGKRIAALRKSNSFFSINPFHVIQWEQNLSDVNNFDLLNEINVNDAFLSSYGLGKIVLNNLGQFILYNDKAGKFFDTNSRTPTTTLRVSGYRTISASFLDDKVIVSLEKQCLPSCLNDTRSLSNIQFSPFLLRTRQVSDLDLSITNSKQISLKNAIESFDINIDDFNKDGIIYLKAHTKNQDQVWEWKPCHNFEQANLFPCFSDTELKISKNQLSQSNKPQSRLEFEGRDLYVYTPSGKRFLLKYDFSGIDKVISSAELIFSQNEEGLIISYSHTNYYFLRENNVFINKRVNSSRNKPIVNNNGLVAVFKPVEEISSQDTSNPRKLDVWDMKSLSTGFSQSFENDLKILRFSQDGKFLIGISYDLLGQGGTLSQRPYVYQLKMHLWLVNPDSILELAQHRLDRAF